MSAHLHRTLMHALGAAALGAAASAAAQPPTARQPDPLDPRADVPAVTYESVLGRSRRTADAAASMAWREANDNVARIGGWRAYAREASQPEPAASLPRASEPRTPPAPHRHGGTAP